MLLLDQHSLLVPPELYRRHMSIRISGAVILDQRRFISKRRVVRLLHIEVKVFDVVLNLYPLLPLDCLNPNNLLGISEIGVGVAGHV